MFKNKIKVYICTAPVQSHSSLNSTYSPSLAYIPNAVTGFPSFSLKFNLASESNNFVKCL